MATECRARKRKKVNRYKLARIEAMCILVALAVGGFAVGHFTAPTKERTITKTVEVEVPIYEEDSLPSVEEVTYYDVPLSHSLQRFIYEVCADEDVPVSLVIAMIDHESDFNPEVVSDTGDYGLMQINTVNHEALEEQYRSADMLNPYQNVFCGVKVISSYLKIYENDYNKALMAYNMGNYGASRAWENGIESTSYTEDILSLMNEYEQEVGKNAANADAE